MVRAFAFAVMIIAKGASAASSGDLFELACDDRSKGTTAADYVKIGCSCTELGHANTATGTAACKKAGDGLSEGTLADCPVTCCKAPTKATCYSVFAASLSGGTHSPKWPVMTANSSFTGCPSDKYLDLTKLTSAVVGTTNAAIALECCAAKPKCSTITCSSRRRSKMISGTIQNKASAAATTCGTDSECIATCCEAITTTCAGAPAANTCTTADTTQDSSKAAVTFTTYATDCCSANMKCSAHTCGSPYKDKTTKATVTCSGLKCSDSECCDYKDTACVKEVATIACGTGMSITDMSKEFATGAAAAAKITACCDKDAVAVAYTCTDFWGAAVGSSNGLISGTVHQSVSLVVGIASIVLLSMAQ